MSDFVTKGILAIAFASTVAGSAFAGGLERAGYDIDLLFDPSKAALEAGVTYVNPDRQIKNARDLDGGATGGGEVITGHPTARDSEPYTVPYFGVKAQIFDGVDCMADYSEPWGVHSAPGRDWNGANSVTEINVESKAYAATCSYRMDAGKGDLRFIGGVVYEEVYGFKEARVAPAAALAPFGVSGIGRLDLDSNGVGWRAGAAYEIPEYALRASLLYNSAVDLGDISGTLDLRQVPGFVNPANPFLGQLIPITGTAKMPQSVELKLQSGIAPDWLAFGSVKWTDWSVLQSVGFCPTAATGLPCPPGGVTSLDLLYRDGWTVSGGIGHKFNDQWSGAVSLTWDRGTTTGLSSQTDSWTLGAGVGYTPNENIEWRVGGAVGLLTSGSVAPVTSKGVTYGTDVAYDFGSDFVGALSTSVKVKF